MSTHALAVLLWVLLVLALTPLVYLCTLLWRRRTKIRYLTLDPRKTAYGGDFMEPSIDFDELERK